MATIRQDNIIVSLEVQGRAETKKALEDTRNEVVGITDATEDLQKTMIEAFEDDVIQDYLDVLQEAGEEIEDLDAAAVGIRNRLRQSFDTTNPEKYAQALSKVSLGLSTGDINSTNFIDSLSNLDNATEKSNRSTTNFFGGLKQKASSGLAAAGTAIAAGAAAIASVVVGVFAAAGAAIGAVFSRAVDRVPSVRENFEGLQQTLSRIGDYIAASLAPIFNRLIDLGERFISAIDLTAVLDAFNSFAITIELAVEQFLALFGLDFNSFGEGLAGVINFVLRTFTAFNRQVAGFSSALRQLFGQIQVFLTDFARGTLEAIDAILPGRQFDQAIANLERNADRLRSELLPGLGAAFQSGINEFDSRLEEARDNYEDFDLFRGFDDDVDKLDKTLQAAVGSIQFYRDQIAALRSDADRVAPDVAAQLLDVVDDLERRLGDAERQIQQRFDNLQGILSSPLDGRVGDPSRTDAFADLARQQAQEYADALVEASLAVANQQIAPQLREIAARVQSSIDAGEFIVTPEAGDTIKELQGEYEDALEVIDRLNKRFAESAKQRADESQAERDRTIQRLNEVEELIGGIDGLFNNVADSFAEAINRQVEALDSLVDTQEQRVNRALVLAERGNAEILQLEEQRLDQILQARERALDRERQLAAVQLAVNQGIAISQGIVAVTRAFAEGNIIGGIAASAALAGSLAAIVITLSDAFSNVPTFFAGTERVEGHRQKMTLIGVHGQERILNADQNNQINPRDSNARVLQLYKLGRMVEENPARAAIMAENGRINTDSFAGGGDYDYNRLEKLMKDNTNAIRKMAGKLAKLSPNVVIPRKDIHTANKGYQRKMNMRKAILK